MKHFFEEITGFLNYKEFYQEAVKSAQDRALFVEIGCFLGKSTSFMGVEIANCNKRIEFHTIDLFDYEMYSEPEKIWYNNSKECKKFKTPFEIFKNNIKPVSSYVNHFKGDSKKLVENYEDNSIDFLFIDGDHSAEGFKKDLELWYPKVKDGGVFAGHDYDHPDIRANVKEFFKEDIEDLDVYQPWTLWKVTKGKVKQSTTKKLLSKIKLNLNWKKANKMYYFNPNQQYELPNDVADYLVGQYGNRFQVINPVASSLLIIKKEKPIETPKLIKKIRKDKNKLLWTVGIVNYKSLSFIKHQLKTLYNFNSVPFKLIICDNSIPSEKKELEKICSKYKNITIIGHESKELGTSCQHSEGLQKILDLVDTEYLLINDPDFFWVQKEYLKTLQDLLDEGYVCVGAPFYRAGFSNDTTPALWGCAYDTKILEDGDFYSFEGKDRDSISKDLTQGKDTGWKLRVKFQKQNLPTYSFGDSFGISLRHNFNKDEQHYTVTSLKSIHEYSYKGEVIAYHLSHGCHETEESFPTMETRRNASCTSKWSNLRDKYSNYFYDLISYGERKLSIDLHFLTKNDEKMLPFFFRHYDKYVTRYFAYYNIYSKDKTLEILKSKKNVTIIEDDNKKMDDRYFRWVKNTLWQKYSNSDNCDWVIICDSDEFLYHENLLDLLKQYDIKGITIPKVRGYQMYCESFPINDDKRQIYEIANKGTPSSSYNKFVVMKPYVFPEYSYGCHFASPASYKGVVKFSDDLGITNAEKAHLKLFHYAMFGESFVEKIMGRQDGLSDFNKAYGLGVYSLDPRSKFNPKIEYEKVKKESKAVI